MALIITAWLLIPRNITEKTNISSQITIPDTNNERPQLQINQEKQVVNNIVTVTNRKKENTFNKVKGNISANIPPDALTNSEDDSLRTNTRNNEMPVIKIRVHAEINLFQVTEGEQVDCLISFTCIY